jgi:hypothetical protein
MAAEEMTVVELQDRFYRDSVSKLMIAYIAIVIMICSMTGILIYVYLDNPPPIFFSVDNEMRVQAAVPLDKPYLSDSDLMQWIAEVLPKALIYDFNYYDKQIDKAKQYFTNNGWTAFSNQLNIYANYNTVQANKLFVTAQITAAPYKLNSGVLEDSDKFGWWVQIPLTIKYDGYRPQPDKKVTFQVLIVRVSTLNNLVGVAIDNIYQAPETTGRP